MEEGNYRINKETLEELYKNFKFDFPADFKKFDAVQVGVDYLEFVKETTGEPVYTEQSIEYKEIPGEYLLYKRNSVSGIYCRV